MAIASESWAAALPEAIAAYNDNSHGGIMGAAPKDVPRSTVLQYELEKQAGYDQAVNTRIYQERVSKLQEAGAFRVLLPKTTWTRTGQARYSEKVYDLALVEGHEAVAAGGSRFPVRDLKPVPRGSGDVSVPRALEAGRPIRDTGAKAALAPFATALRGILGGG